MTRLPVASKRGTRLVIAMVLIGVAAGSITLTYWNIQARWLRSQQDQSAPEVPTEAAGAAVWDQAAAQTQLEELQQRFNQIAGDHADTSQILHEAQRLVERYPQYAPARTFLGQGLIHRGQFEQAYEQLGLSLDLNPQQPEVHLLAGTLGYQLKRFDRAIGHYSMAVGMVPSNPRYRLHLAQAYLRQRKTDQARDELLTALKIDSTMHEAYASLADLYAQQNKLHLALAQIQKAIQYTPPGSPQDQRSYYTRRKAKLLLRDNRPEEALMSLQNIGPRGQSDPAVMDDMANCWSMLGKPERAAQMFERGLAVDPSRWVFAAKAALWRIKSHDPEAARGHLATLRRINPRTPVIEELTALLESKPADDRGAIPPTDAD